MIKKHTHSLSDSIFKQIHQLKNNFRWQNQFFSQANKNISYCTKTNSYIYFSKPKTSYINQNVPQTRTPLKKVIKINTDDLSAIPTRSTMSPIHFFRITYVLSLTFHFVANRTCVCNYIGDVATDFLIRKKKTIASNCGMQIISIHNSNATLVQ